LAREFGATLATFQSGARVRWTIAVLASAVAIDGAQAQVIRGMVTEHVSGQPLRGVLVSVASVPDSVRPGGVRHTLTNERGEFAIRLSSGGDYVLSAKRIGVARFTTAPVTVRAGETRRIDVELERFEYTLPVVNVVESALCFRRSEQKRQIIALWDEVRTALLATVVSREERLLSGSLSRYVRTLEPGTLRILEDRRTNSEGFFDRPMRSLSGDSLQKVGYWGKQDADTLVFYGPDEEVLLSSAFRSGHCFELITGRDAIRGFVGLGFRPRGPNLKGGIEGTLWIDAGKFELRFIVFRYTNLITIPSSPHLGGQVHYDRHPSGAWFVRRWFIRMPLFPEVVTVDVGLGPGRSSPRPILWRILEEGGGLYTPGLRSWETPGTITGVITDSTGQLPLHGTVVGLSGTPLSTQVDSSGRFRFDSIAPGAYTLLASNPDYSAFGQLADDEPLTVVSGQEYHATMRAITTTQLRTIICDAARAAAPLFSKAPPPPPPGAATVRILVTRADSGTALTRFPVWLRWVDPAQVDSVNPLTVEQMQRGERKTRLQGVQSMTDDIGGVTFCGVPAETPLELVMLRGDDDPAYAAGARAVRISSFVLNGGELALRTFSVVPPK
jgi:hypothetical protein